MTALATIIAVLAAVYVIPPVFGMTWRYGLSGVGKWAVTWVGVAALYDLFVNADENAAFTYYDAGITFFLTGVTRAALARFRG